VRAWKAARRGGVPDWREILFVSEIIPSFAKIGRAVNSGVAGKID
jgi:hypothetical protein